MYFRPSAIRVRGEGHVRINDPVQVVVGASESNNDGSISREDTDIACDLSDWI